MRVQSLSKQVVIQVDYIKGQISEYYTPLSLSEMGRKDFVLKVGAECATSSSPLDSDSSVP